MSDQSVVMGRLAQRRRALLMSTALVLAGVVGGPAVADSILHTYNPSDNNSGTLTDTTSSYQLDVESGSATQSGSINDGNPSGPLEKIGAGTLTLTNTGSNFTGGIKITAGTLAVGSDQAAGPADGTITMNGGTFEETTGFATNRAFVLDENGTIQIDSGSLGKISGTISGSGAFIKTGAGDLRIDGASNSYTGGTEIDGGSLKIGADANLGTTSNLSATVGDVTLGGGTLNANATFSTARYFHLTQGTTSTISVTGMNKTLTLTGPIDGEGNLVKDGTSKLVLSGNDTMGTLEVKAGELDISTTGEDEVQTGALTVDSGSTLSISSGATLTVATGQDLTNNGTVTNYGTVSDDLVNTGTYSNTGTENADVSSNIGVSAVITNEADATWNGDVKSNAATINNDADATWIGDVLSNTGTISNGGDWTGSITSSGEFDTTGTLTGNVDNSGTFNAEGTVTGNVTNEHGGTFTLTNAGVDDYASGGSPVGIDHLTNEGTFDLNGNELTIGMLSGTATTASITSSSAATLTTGLDNSAATTYAGTIDGLISLDKEGSNTLTLTGINSYTGTTKIGDGILALAGSGSIGASSLVEIADGASLDLTALTGTTSKTLSALKGDGSDAGVNLQNNDAGQTLGVTGAISGDMTAYLDLNASAGTADRLQSHAVADDADIALDIALVGPAAMVSNVHVIDTSATSESLASVTSNLPTSGSIIYSLDKIDNGNGGSDWVVNSTANPAVGNLLGTIGLAQSTISDDFNWPSSGVAGGGASDAQVATCGAGPWIHGTGGYANANLTATALGVSSTSAANMTYSGVQAGVDLACFKAGDIGVTIGAMGGYNSGTVSQDLTADAAGTTAASFGQEYGGVHALISKGQFSAEFQARYDSTSLTFNNDVLALNDAAVTAQRVTFAGRASYALDLNGVSVTPMAGLSVSRTTSSTLVMGSGLDQQALAPDVAISTVAFVGGTVTKTFTAADGKSSVTPFVTGSLSNDFAADPTGVFSAGGTSETVSSDNGGTMGQASVGVNYAHAFESATGAPQHFTASFRGYVKYSNDLVGAGATAGLHLQF